MARRISFLFLIVLALSASSIGVSAQSPSPVAPVWFTGKIFPVPCDDVTPTFEITDDVVRTRGMDCHGTMQATDPRFAGSYLTFDNSDRYASSGDVPGFTVWTSVRRIENDGGAWQGSASSGAARDPSVPGWEGDIANESVVFTGEGGYAGLTAIVVFMPFVNGSVRGVIFEGSPPPAASPAG